MTLVDEATERSAELEGPQEVVDLLEVRANGVNLVDNVLNAMNAELAQVVADLAVVIQANALVVDLAEATLVDQLANSLQGRVTEGDERHDAAKHHLHGLVDLHEHTVVELTKTQQLQNLAGLRGQ